MAALGAISILAPRPASAQDAPERNAYFGESHVHTSWSFDAFMFGNTRTTPEDAYRYAKGEPIEHPLGYPIRIETPLDWMGVTDHAEYAGVVQMANDPTSAFSKTPLGQKLIVRSAEDIQRIDLLLGNSMIDGQPFTELMKPEVAGSVWKRNNALADAANEPGRCTAFCAYE